jgi:protein involved in polysaccharide export with SLBB domain
MLQSGDGLEAAISGINYRLGPGDVLAINIWGPRPISYQIGVTPEGNVLIPAGGEVYVNDLPLSEAKRVIQERVLRSFRNVDVGVTLVRLRRFQIHVLGQVRHPGTYLATAVDRVSVAVGRAGGFNEGASQRDVTVGNSDTLRVRADLVAFLKRGILEGNPRLRDGDVVYVPFAKARVQVLGAVSEPGPVQFLDGDRLSTVLNLAGGLSMEAFPDTLELARYRPGTLDPVRLFIVPGAGVVPQYPGDQDMVPQVLGTFSPEALAGSEAWPAFPDFELQPDDIVLVRSVPEYRKRRLVEVTGEVAYPGSYPIHEGSTRLADVVRWAGGLTPHAFLPEAVLIRRAAAGLTDKEFDRLKNVPVADMSEQEYAYFKVKARENPGAMVVDFETAFRDSASSDNLFLERGDLIVIPTHREFVSVLGLVRHPGNVTFRGELEPKEYVNLAGGYAADADRGRARVIRAEGGEWVSFRRAGRVKQGDSIFVPEKPDLDYWRAFRDFLTVAMQLATIYLVVDSATN